MNINNPQDVEILLDRLVDGELSGMERRQLLESFDKCPEGWRRCALAFLEAQSWRDELGRVARGPTSQTNEPKSPASSAPHSRTSLWSSMGTWLAMAACLLLAFGLGMMQRDRSHTIADGSSNSIGQVASVSPPSNAASPDSAKPGEAITLFVQDENGRRQPVRVPLVDASTLDKQLGVQFQSGLSDDVRNQLKNNGYAVHSKRQYAPLWFEKEKGRPMILPVEDTKIVPVSNRVY